MMLGTYNDLCVAEVDVFGKTRGQKSTKIAKQRNNYNFLQKLLIQENSGLQVACGNTLGQLDCKIL